MSILEVVLLCVVATAVAAVVGSRLFKRDTETENRRRASARLAGVLSGLGLKKIPEFLIDYSVGDYSGMAKKIADTARLFLDGEAAVVAEFDAVFENLLNAKLGTESGRAYIAAKLEDATQDTDVSIIQNAPQATTV